MYSRQSSESAAQELDGEVLEGSGFETEQPEAGFESDRPGAMEAIVQ